MEGMKTQRMYVSRLAGCSGTSPSVLLLYIFFFFALETDEFLDFMLSPKSQSHLISAAPHFLIYPEIMFQLIRSVCFLKMEP